jgi:anaerobic selenocysteine-containing dehydrogenase
VAVQTSGANALAAVRLAAKLQTIPLGDALADDGACRIAIGADVVGMLGGIDVPVAAAAAPLPNCTTDQAEIVLPVAMAAECGGTWLSGGAQPVRASAVMAPPAGVPTPGELVAALASGTGVGRAQTRAEVPPLERLSGGAPAEAPAALDPPKPALLLGRQALHAGCGALTAGGSWQAAMQPLPELRMSPSDAEAAGIGNLAIVTVRAGGQSLRAAARIAPELPPGTVVLPEGRAEARRLSPCRVESGGAVVAAPVAAELAPTGESGGDGES